MSDININENEELLENDQVEEKPAEEAKTYDVVIEDARQDLYKSYAKSRRISNIIMFAVVIAICGIMFLIINNEQVLKIIGYCLAGALIVGMIVYYLLTRKNLPNKVKSYVPLVMQTLNQRMFSCQGFSEIKNDPEEKLQMDDLVGDGVFAEASSINSRNVVRGVYNGHHFLYAEAALTRPAQKKQQVPPLFVGRYISVPNQMKFDGRFVFNLKNPKQPLDLPNAVSDLAVLEEKDELVVYGPENANYHEVINNKMLSQFKKLNIEGHLLNVNIVIWGGHTAVYLSYDDSILSVPFDKLFEKDGFEKSLDDLVICLQAMSEE